jgi:MtrB/PioB family decaheme-associated outer membrane protein
LATAIAMALGFTTAAKADDELPSEVTEPESTASAGAGYVNNDNRRFGEYRGLTENGGYLLLDVDFLRRDDDSGTWLSVRGRDLGLDSRELTLEYDRQGRWGGYIEYSQIPRDYPLLLNTGLTGIGTATQTINGTALRGVTLGTERDRYTLGFNIGLPADLSFEIKFRDEAKDGTRLFGRGTGELLVEPIDSRTRQMEAILSYTGKKLQLVGGYYGTDYSSQPLVLDVNVGADIALPPDNQSHQLYLSGGYSFAPTTRATFKVSYGKATQDENFFTAPTFPGNTQSNLDGRIDTTAAQLGLTTRIGSSVSLLANLRYEDRDDKTPRHQFLDASTGRDGFNTPFSRTTTAGKVEATYFAPLGFMLTGGVDYDQRKRSVLSIRQVSWREENDELTYRIEGRRSLSETLNGAISYAHSDRTGSDYLPANNNTTADYIDPVHFADRQRDKIRLSLDWTPMEMLSLQLMVDSASDVYDGRRLGPVDGEAKLYSLDATYTLSESWQVNAWLSHDETRVGQMTITGANGTAVLAQEWAADVLNHGDAIGVGARGRLTDSLELGADIAYQKDATNYGLITTLPTAPPAGALPNISNKQTTAKVFARYSLSERFAVRADAEYAQYQTNDWTWLNWVYTDTSTGFLNPQENTVFFGVSVYYKLQ